LRHYLGTDVVPELVSYARTRCAIRNTWRFSLVNGLTIPQRDASADFIAFFSVFTHLARNECLAYLKEAKRVMKPDGKIVVSYLDPSAAPPSYWYAFFARRRPTGSSAAASKAFFRAQKPCENWPVSLAAIRRLSAALGRRAALTRMNAGP
jgi:ubiquinone/menaquinone biosynthesis C-methylase UbiE